jgi:hypothetical protein
MGGDDKLFDKQMNDFEDFSLSEDTGRKYIPKKPKYIGQINP